MKIIWLLIWLLLASTSLFSISWAEMPEEEGLVIAIAADKRDAGFGLNRELTIINYR